MKSSTAPTPREIRIAVAGTAALLFLIVILGPITFHVGGLDFGGLYAGGSILRHGNASQLYDMHAQAQAERELLNRPDFMIYDYPPVVALLFAPFTIFGYLGAYFIWGAINVLLWICFQNVVRPFAPIPKQPYRYLMLCSLFIPLCFTLFQGQMSLLLLVAYSLAFVQLKRGRDFNAGLFLGLGLLKFQLVLPFALIFLLRGKWKFIAGFACAAAAMVALSAIAVGPAGVIAYGTLLIHLIRDPLNPAWGAFEELWRMPTIRSFLSVLLGAKISPVWIKSSAAAISAALILFTAWSWHRAERRDGPSSLNAMFAAALAVTLVTGFHLYVYDLTLMILAVLLVIGSPQWQIKSRWRPILIALIAILYFAPMYVLLLKLQKFYLVALPLLAFALSGLAMGGAEAKVTLTGVEPAGGHAPALFWGTR